MAFRYTGPLDKLDGLKTQIAAAVEIAQRAEKAFAAGDVRSARLWHDYADESCTDVVREITKLSDEEADAIEPVFTRFEDQLIRVRVLLRPHSAPREDWHHATSCAALHRLM